MGVPVNFTLITTYLNASVPESKNITEIQDQYYVFLENNTSCDIGFYNFQIVATTADEISSGPSEIIIKSIPSPPGTPLIEGVQEHSLFKTANGGFTLIVNHQVRIAQQ